LPPDRTHGEAEARREACAICGLFLASGAVWLLLPWGVLGLGGASHDADLHLLGDALFLGISAVLLYVLIRRALSPPKPDEPAAVPESPNMADRAEALLVHDLLNVPTAVSGHAELALERVPPAHAVHADLVALRNAVQRGQRLARGPARGPAPTEPVDLAALVAEVGRVLPRLTGASIHVSVQLDLAPAPVLADPARLEQVVLNLALNAREAMPGGGRLQLRVAAWRPAGAGPDHVELAVSDTGHGFDAVTRERLFEPWFSTRGRGSGLGLATLADTVREAGGHVDIESAPGRGATFRVRLPLAARRATVAQGAGEALLLVDGLAGRRATAARSLRQAGYRVSEADGAPAALEHAQREAPALMVLGGDTPSADQARLAASLAALPSVQAGPEDQLQARVRTALDASTPTPAPTAQPVVLVVDDDSAVRDVITSILRAAGYAVLPAADGREALELVQRHAIAVVLLDMLMPGKEGLETMTEMRQRQPRLPVVAMSGASRAANYLTLATKLGAVAALAKPFGRDELLRVLRSVTRPPSANTTPEVQPV